MMDVGAFASRLAEAADLATACGRLAETLFEWVHSEAPRQAAARVYLLRPSDTCPTCPRSTSCAARDHCLHLQASLGEIDRPVALDQRIPRLETVWGQAARGSLPQEVVAPPPELAGGDPRLETHALLIPLEAGGKSLGVVGLRGPASLLRRLLPDVQVASFLTASALSLLESLGTAIQRFEMLLLVNELGRKVNAIFNDDLLLRQAVVDIARTFGFPNVMIFMVDPNRTRLELKAQASTSPRPPDLPSVLTFDQGIVGRAFRTGTTQVVGDVAQSAEYVPWFPDTRSELATTIQIGDVVEGVLNVESDHAAAFGPTERVVLETIANQLAIAIENARLFSMVREREDRYRTLVESSPGGVFHLDGEGRILYANPAALGMIGRSGDAPPAAGRRIDQLAAPLDRERLAEAIRSAKEGAAVADLEFQLQPASGRPRWLQGALQPLVGEDGRARGVVLLARDRTRERELHDRLTQSDKMSAIGTLVSGVAHELNNPLAGILGFAQLLLARPPDEWSRDDLERIEENARRCQRIVENLLAFARQRRMSRRRANLNDVIRTVVDLNAYQFRLDNVRVASDLDPRLPALAIDTAQWQQVLINLLGNAHQALLSIDQADRQVHIQTRLVGDAVLLRVRDNGPGIPAALRHRIFEPFFTTKETGTGLGLGICFGIVEEHGGTIRLDPTAAQGACFEIQIPCPGETDLSQAAPGVTPPPSELLSARVQGRRVLVVDDDAYVCDVIRRRLEGAGFRVGVAHDAALALRAVEEALPDVVLLDVRLSGGIDGIDLHQLLRGRDPALGQRVVFMTGSLLDARTAHCLQQIDAPCITKPFDIHALTQLVAAVALDGTAAKAASSIAQPIE